MDEINDLAGQHEVVAEDLQTNVIRELSVLVKDLREDRKVTKSHFDKLKRKLKKVLFL